MNGKLMVYIDQYNNVVTAKTLKELQDRSGGGRISKMYKGSKETVHIGYVVGPRWFLAYTPYENVE